MGTRQDLNTAHLVLNFRESSTSIQHPVPKKCCGQLPGEKCFDWTAFSLRPWRKPDQKGDQASIIEKWHKKLNDSMATPRSNPTADPFMMDRNGQA